MDSLDVYQGAVDILEPTLISIEGHKKVCTSKNYSLGSLVAARAINAVKILSTERERNNLTDVKYDSLN